MTHGPFAPPEELLSFLKGEDRFLLATHEKPEGDALGSTLAFASALRAVGKTVFIYDRDPVPELFRFLPGWAEFLTALPAAASDMAVVLLDCGHPSRAGLDGVPFRMSLVIDHHRTEFSFGDAAWVEPDCPATGLMVHAIIKALGVEITKDMAVNLYTAVATDTGIFRYDNTSAEALEVCAELVRAGAEPARVAECVYETWTPGRMRLLALALQTLDMRDGAVAMTISHDMFRSTGTSLEDVENFTAFPRMLKGARAAALFSEVEPGVVKASLRSKGGMDVRLIAEGFGGGGHRNAAGYRMKTSPDEAKELFFRTVFEAARKAV